MRKEEPTSERPRKDKKRKHRNKSVEKAHEKVRDRIEREEPGADVDRVQVETDSDPTH